MNDDNVVPIHPLPTATGTPLKGAIPASASVIGFRSDTAANQGNPNLQTAPTSGIGPVVIRRTTARTGGCQDEPHRWLLYFPGDLLDYCQTHGLNITAKAIDVALRAGEQEILSSTR